jgi:hypothetical protein
MRACDELRWCALEAELSRLALGMPHRGPIIHGRGAGQQCNTYLIRRWSFRFELDPLKPGSLPNINSFVLKRLEQKPYWRNGPVLSSL